MIVNRLIRSRGGPGYIYLFGTVRTLYANYMVANLT